MCFIIFSYILAKYITAKSHEYRKEENALLNTLSNPFEDEELMNIDISPPSPVPGTSKEPVNAVLTDQKLSLEIPTEIIQSEKPRYHDIYSNDVDVEVIPLDKIPGVKRGKEVGFNELVKKKDSMKAVPQRMLHRVRLVVKYLKTYQVIDELYKLMKLVVREEIKIGYQERICKKSMLRILSRMMADNYIRCYNIVLKHSERITTKLFICDNSVNENHPVLKSYIDQAKAKYSMSIRSRLVKSSKKSATTEMMDQFVPQYDAEVNYGYCPKFLRMRIYHEFLYHIIYDLPEDTQPFDTEETLNIWRANDVNINVDDLRNCIGPIYSPVISETMFIPPLVRQPPYTIGWVILSDVLARLPLSIFLKLVNVNYKVPGLEEWMNDKIKRYVLVNNLPESLKVPLMHSRKFIFAIDDIAKQLCIIGLLQYGPPKYLNKEMVYVYLNRKAILYNTTTSPPAYYMVDASIKYEKFKYIFDSNESVKHYWTDLRSICINTRLNVRKTLQEAVVPANKNIFNLDIFRNAFQFQTVTTAVANDIGHIPGDARGAAGLDSSLYSHLKRNWNWSAKVNMNHRNPPYKRKRKIEQTETSTMIGIPFKKLIQEKEIATSSIRNCKRKIIPIKRFTARVLPKMQMIGRKKLPSSTNKARCRKPAYDEVDRLALEQMNKLRVDWTTAEDNILLLCKIGTMYFHRNKRLVFVTFSTVRDILQWKLKSLNKTSRSCQRRINFMMKNAVTLKNIHLCLEEVRTNPAINERFGKNFYSELKVLYRKHRDFSTALKIHFIDLVCLLIKYFSNLQSPKHDILIPDTLPQFNVQYNSNLIELSHGVIYDDPTTRYSIEYYTIYGLIHSSMCCIRDKTSWNIQLFEIYKSYSDKLLAHAMVSAREHQLIALNKSIKKRRLGIEKFLPLATHPFHLSATYQFQITTKISYEMFDQIYAICNKIFFRNDRRIEEEFNILQESSCGLVFLLSEINYTGKFHYKIGTPKRVLVLDPEKEKIDPLYERITKKFSDTFSIIQKITTNHMMESDNVEVGNYNKVRFCPEPDKIHYALSPTEKLMKFPNEYFHFFCLLLNPKIEFNFKSKDTQSCSSTCILTEPNYFEIIITIIETSIETTPDISLKFRELIDNIINKKLELDKKDIGKLNNAIKLKPFDLFSVISEMKESFCDDYETGWIKQYWRHEIDEDDEHESVNEFDFIPRINDQTMFDDVSKDDLCEKIRRLHDYFVVNASKIYIKMKPKKVNESILDFDYTNIDEVLENFRL